MNILIVDDEAVQRSLLAGYLTKQKHTVLEAGSVTEALEQFKTKAVDAILTDYKMPDGTGLDLLQQVKLLHAEPTVVIITAYGSIEGAVTAMRKGAYDYLTKPINLDELSLVIKRIEEFRQLKSENELLREQLIQQYSFTGIIAHSKQMQQVLGTAVRIARSNAPVLLRGESGTGKELIAKAIHYSSKRSSKPFIAVNCAALNENVLESELFGHEKGAFTGADRTRRGRFELADGGTLFLDEIGDISLNTQVKLLRVLQEFTFERVGGSESIHVDVRIIAATNKNIEEAIQQGTFREDLYYRLNVVTIDIPPLRKRREDIPPLLDYYLKKFSHENSNTTLSFSKEAWEILLRYDYPGNVRELENIVHRAVVMSRGAMITLDDLPQTIQHKEPEITAQHPVASLPERIKKLEKELIFDALQKFNNNQSKAAASLGISERTLRYKLKKWGIK